MPEPKEDFTSFLKKVFIFSGLSDERLARLAEQVEAISFDEGQLVYSEGDLADAFYIVLDGRIRLSTGMGSQKKDWDTLIPSDFFGEDQLLANYRTETAAVLLPSRVLWLSRDNFLALLEEDPELSDMIRATAESRRLARRQNFQWLGRDESVYVIARKHEFFLFLELILPILLGVTAIPVMVWGFASSLPWLSVAGFVLLVLSIGAGIWLWLDWRNDYYIVTSQRVVWLEKVILLYDSRQEAPLNTVLSKNTVFNQVLRMFINYGNLIVRTFTGSIAMRRVYQPELLVRFIDGLQARARELARLAEAEKMEDLIRERLRLPPKKRLRPVLVVTPAVPAPPKRQSGLEKIFTNFLKVRYEKGDTITYRKHWFILLQKIWLPLLVLAAVLIGIIVLARAFPDSGLVSPLTLSFFWTPVVIGILIWAGYHYADWRNDVYVVTQDAILDIERKPLSKEEKKSAPLANILSLEHTRKGILGLLLNFGNVIVNIGVEKFDFYGVYNPAQVQYEISDRMYAQRRRKEEADAAKERERLVGWLAMYHRQVDKLEDIETEADWDVFSG
jgi:hypothetical protein